MVLRQVTTEMFRARAANPFDEPPTFSVITLPNGTGKSSVLAALHLLLRTDERLDEARRRSHELAAADDWTIADDDHHTLVQAKWSRSLPITLHLASQAGAFAVEEPVQPAAPPESAPIESLLDAASAMRRAVVRAATKQVRDLAAARRDLARALASLLGHWRSADGTSPPSSRVVTQFRTALVGTATPTAPPAAA